MNPVDVSRRYGRKELTPRRSLFMAFGSFLLLILLGFAYSLGVLYTLRGEASRENLAANLTQAESTANFISRLRCEWAAGGTAQGLEPCRRWFTTSPVRAPAPELSPVGREVPVTVVGLVLKPSWTRALAARTGWRTSSVRHRRPRRVPRA